MLVLVCKFEVLFLYNLQVVGCFACFCFEIQGYVRTRICEKKDGSQTIKSQISAEKNVCMLNHLLFKCHKPYLPMLVIPIEAYFICPHPLTLPLLVSLYFHPEHLLPRGNIHTRPVHYCFSKRLQKYIKKKQD